MPEQVPKTKGILTPKIVNSLSSLHRDYTILKDAEYKDVQYYNITVSLKTCEDEDFNYGAESFRMVFTTNDNNLIDEELKKEGFNLIKQFMNLYRKQINKIVEEANIEICNEPGQVVFDGSF